MRYARRPLPLPSPIANGNGSTVVVKNWIDKYVFATAGTRSYSIAIEYTIDGTNWHELVAASAGAIAPTALPQPAVGVRAVVSSYVSETAAPDVIVAGRNAVTY